MRIPRFLLSIWHAIFGLAAAALAFWIIFPDAFSLPQISLSHQDPTTESTQETSRTDRAVDPTKPTYKLSDKGQIIADGPLSLPPEIEDNMITVDKKPKAENPLSSVQHTTLGRVALGKDFFNRLLQLSVHLPPLHTEIAAEARRRKVALSSSATGSPDPEFAELRRWWQRTGSLQHNIFPETTQSAERFDALARKTRTPQEDEELWQLVIKCGRDWLKIPFDQRTQRFDLDAPLPDDALEINYEKSQRIYAKLTGQEWSDRPKARVDWWRDR